ncbi:aspartic peptidase A1 [Lactarius pseudohatsudake]|nr:aspartic peptidase A1 [Lactarius pseudohatsudake]
MLLTASLMAVLLLVVSVAADPIVVRKSPVSLPIARHLNITGAHDLIRKDQARARNMFAASKVKRSGSPAVSITNLAVAYGANVGIGSPPTFYSLLIDTGCGNIGIGGGKAYVRTGSSTPLPGSACDTCGVGSCEEFSDIVTLSPTFVFRASIGVASTSTGFQGFDGVLGIGPTVGTSSSLVGNLFSQGIITANLVSVSFEPTTNTSITNGELTIGGTDPTRFTGTITFIPGTATFPASEFGGIDESIRYGASTTILSTTAGIVDSGTTLILIATGKYPVSLKRMITSTQFSNLQSLFFTAGGISFELTANAQIWPRSLNTLIGGTTGSIYLVVNDIGSPTGSGLDFINGYTFLERFYSVFDYTNNRIGFATTPFTTATTN